VQVVTYRQREPEHPFLDDLLRAEPAHSGAGEPLWIVSWGFDVPKLLRRLRGRAVAYHAHSSGYGFNLPPGVPVLAVSRNSLGYWGDRSPRNPLFLVPNALEPTWFERGARGSDHSRPIDVLVQARKTSAYVLKQLLPALRRAGLRVELQSGWVEDLVDLFNSAKVVLYDSAPYWRGRGVSEGFGLPPIEALACGCVVFSSFNHALADNLDPGLIGHQIGAGTLAGDLETHRCRRARACGLAARARPVGGAAAGLSGGVAAAPLAPRTARDRQALDPSGRWRASPPRCIAVNDRLAPLAPGCSQQAAGLALIEHCRRFPDTLRRCTARPSISCGGCFSICRRSGRGLWCGCFRSRCCRACWIWSAWP